MDMKPHLDLKAMIRGLCKAGLSQEAIALAVEVNQSTISRILSGKYQNSNFKLAMGIHLLYMQHCQAVSGASSVYNIY